MSKVSADYPTYLELGVYGGEITSVNGKEFNKSGIINVLNYIASDCRISTDEVIDVAKSSSVKEGYVKMKLFNGSVTCL